MKAFTFELIHNTIISIEDRQIFFWSFPTSSSLKSMNSMEKLSIPSNQFLQDTLVDIVAGDQLHKEKTYILSSLAKLLVLDNQSKMLIQWIDLKV